MGELAKILLAWLTNPVRGMGAVVIAACAMLWFRHYQFFSEAAKDPFWRWILLALMISAAGIVTYPVEKAYKEISGKYAKRVSCRAIIKRLSDLAPAEKRALQQFIAKENRAFAFGREGGAVDVLARDGILSVAEKPPEPICGAIPADLYLIHEVAYKHLREHPELLDPYPKRPVTPSSSQQTW